MAVSPPPPPPTPGLEPSGSAGHEPLHRTSVVSESAIGVDWAVLGSGERVNLASPGARLGARIIDVLIVVVALLILVFTSSGSVVDAMFIAPLIWCVYEVVLIAVRGQTLGKMLVKVKVVRVDFGSVLGAGKSVGRWIIPFAGLVVPVITLLVYIWMLWDRNRQGLHDKAAGTVVVKAS